MRTSLPRREMSSAACVGYLSFCGRTVAVTRKAIKNLHLRIKPPNREILVSAPYAVSDGEILAFLSKHTAWIERHLAFCTQPKAPLSLCDGVELSLFGSPLILRLVEGRRNLSTFDGTTLTLSDKGEPKRALSRFYREEMTARVEPMLELWSEGIGTPLPSLRLRAMTSRWGSCHVQKKIVTLNLRLALYPTSLVEYVLVHELVHFHHPNHSPAFYAALASHLPDWHDRKRQLEGMARQSILPDPFT